MPSSGYFDTPFATAGTRTTVPDTAQLDGSVSYENGYGVDYTLPPSDPSALNIEQDKFNQLMYDVTSAIQYFQQGKAAAFITSAMNGGSPFSYSQGDVVLLTGIRYVSLINANTDTPPTANWGVVDNRIQLIGPTDYYVATSGNDTTGNGSAGAPWATLQHAANYLVSNVDLVGNVATVNVAAGTYSAGVGLNVPFTGGGQVVFKGDYTTPTNCVIALTSGICFDANDEGTIFGVGGFKISNAAGEGLVASSGGQIFLSGKMEFGACVGGRQMYAVNNALINCNAKAYTISGGGQIHAYATKCSSINLDGTTVTLTGTPAYSTGFADADRCAVITAGGTTYSGSATGVRYVSALNAVIDTTGGGANFFPGNSAGSTATGGQYV